MADPSERWQKLFALENDKATSDHERAVAKRMRERLEAKHPGVAQTWKEEPAKPDYSGRVKPGEGPGPYDASEPVPRAHWRKTAVDWIRSAVEEAARGITLHQMVRDYTDIEINGNTKTVHVHVRLPMDVIEDVIEMHGSLQEYAHLVGAMIGTELAATFEENSL
jgi:hypothetical protein